jgi:hypothetical protein
MQMVQNAFGIKVKKDNVRIKHVPMPLLLTLMMQLAFNFLTNAPFLLMVKDV